MSRLILAAFGLLFLADRASACGALVGSAPYWVDDADVIVRARAVEQRDHVASELYRRDYPKSRIVRFELIETLKGTVPQSLEFEGELTTLQVMDENEPAIPRKWVRKGGRSGNCHALHYRAGEEYLLLLKRQNGSLTPYWAAMAATNEHVEGDADPWLRWVRDRLARR